MSVLVKKKCENCLKKTLYYNTCKCQKELCLKCLSSFSHNCNFDFKQEKKDHLFKTNPQIIASKLENI
jgi:hypothetical protein